MKSLFNTFALLFLLAATIFSCTKEKIMLNPNSPSDQLNDFKYEANSNKADTPYYGGKLLDTPYVGGKVLDTPYIGGKIIDTPYIGGKILDTPYVGGKIIDTPYVKN